MNIGNNSVAQLRSFVERIERLDGEIDELNQDKSAVRRKDPGMRTEEDALFAQYMDCLNGIEVDG